MRNLSRVLLAALLLWVRQAKPALWTDHDRLLSLGCRRGAPAA
jgi:hypothetical protein